MVSNNTTQNARKRQKKKRKHRFNLFSQNSSVKTWPWAKIGSDVLWGGSKMAQMWLGRGSDMARTRLGRGSDMARHGSDVARTWLGRGSDAARTRLGAARARLGHGSGVIWRSFGQFFVLNWKDQNRKFFGRRPWVEAKDVLILYEFRKMPRTNEACVSKSVVSRGQLFWFGLFWFSGVVVFAILCYWVCLLCFVLLWLSVLIKRVYLYFGGSCSYCCGCLFPCAWCLLVLCVRVSLCEECVGAWGFLPVGRKFCLLGCRDVWGDCQRVVGMFCKCSGLFR